MFTCFFIYLFPLSHPIWRQYLCALESKNKKIIKTTTEQSKDLVISSEQ